MSGRIEASIAPSNPNFLTEGTTDIEENDVGNEDDRGVRDRGRPGGVRREHQIVESLRLPRLRRRGDTGHRRRRPGRPVHGEESGVDHPPSGRPG